MITETTLYLRRPKHGQKEKLWLYITCITKLEMIWLVPSQCKPARTHSTDEEVQNSAHWFFSASKNSTRKYLDTTNLMGDPGSRKSAAVSRLRQHLRKKRESLADHFEFKMYVAFVFKDKVSKSQFRFALVFLDQLISKC